jgi:uncharacterized membrane-anchored protein YhcB (DUF1043 family)
MPEPISMVKLAADLENLQKQFNHYKQEVEKAVAGLNDRIKKLEQQTSFD